MTSEIEAAQAQTRILPNTNEVNWAPDAPLPAGVAVESLRRRGIDILRMTIETAKPARTFMSFLGLAKPKPSQTTITIVEEKIKVEVSQPEKSILVK